MHMRGCAEKAQAGMSYLLELSHFSLNALDTQKGTVTTGHLQIRRYVFLTVSRPLGPDFFQSKHFGFLLNTSDFHSRQIVAWETEPPLLPCSLLMYKYDGLKAGAGPELHRVEESRRQLK